VKDGHPSPNEAIFLARLATPMGTSELARALGWHPSVAMSCLQRMRAHGLVIQLVRRGPWTRTETGEAVGARPPIDRRKREWSRRETPAATGKPTRLLPIAAPGYVGAIGEARRHDCADLAHCEYEWIDAHGVTGNARCPLRCPFYLRDVRAREVPIPSTLAAHV